MGPIVRQCRQCKKIFQSFGSNICPDCADELETNFEIVKEYIYSNPGENVVSISKGTGVPEKTVLYYMKEGRLSIDSAEPNLECEKCKKAISSGRFCKECQVMLENTLFKSYVQSKQSMADEARKALAGKMHISKEQ
jgi:predicted amidophosphoribosyltransferase